MFGILTDNPNHTFAADYPTVVAHLFNGCPHLHNNSLLVPISNPSPRQIIRGQLNRHLVSGENFNKMHSHLARNVSQNHMTLIQLHMEGCVGQRLHHRTVNLYRFFLSQNILL